MSKVKSNYEIISDKTKNPVTSTEYIKHGNEWLNDVISGSDYVKMAVTTSKTFNSEEGYCYVTDWTRNLIDMSIDNIKRLNTTRTWNGNSCTWRGITFTINDNGSVTISGTNTGSNSAKIYLTDILPTDNDFYILVNNSYEVEGKTGLVIEYLNSSKAWADSKADDGTGTRIGTNYPYFDLVFQVPKGYTVNNLTIFPMFSKGTNINSYVPYSYEIMSSNSDGTDNDAVTVSTELSKPVMLKTFDGETTVTSPAEIEIVTSDNKQANVIAKEINSSKLGSDLLDKAECGMFAHHITDGGTPQAFCVYNYNGIRYAACATCKNDNHDTSSLTIYNLDTGIKITTITDELFEHMNDMTFYDDMLYITNSNSTNTVVVCDLSDYSVSEIGVVGYSDETLHGIEWHNGNFYIITKLDGAYHLHKYTEQLDAIISTRKLYRSTGFTTTQGLFAYDKYICFVCGQNDRTKLEPYTNLMQVYSTDDFTPIKSIYVPYGAELEGVGCIDGDFYYYYNVSAKSGLILKGTIIKGEKVYGTENLSELIGIGRFEKSVEIYIDENSTKFFVNNTASNPFTFWLEANLFMINQNTPRYNINLLSDISTEITIHPTINSYVYVYGKELSGSTVKDKLRNVTNKFALANGSVMGVSNLNFTGSSAFEIAYCDDVVINSCTFNRDEKPTIKKCNSVDLSGTSINKQISVNNISSLNISGTFTAINECIDSNRLIGAIRITSLPTDKADGWKPFTTSASGSVYAGSIEICKKLLGYNISSADIKTLEDTDVVADLNLQGRYNISANNAIVDVPNHNSAFIELINGSGDKVKDFVFKNTNSSKMYRRSMNVDFDSGWVEVQSDTHVSISLFEKVGVIGDSFASGETYTTGSPVDNYNVSWLQILARQNGFTGTNYSKGGLTSQTWLTDAKGLPLLQSSDAENLYLVALGINDANRMTLGTADDIGSETSTTFYGCYSRIINAVKAKNNKAKIICLSPARFGGNYDTFANAIKVISGQLNVPFVDITTHPFFKTGFFENNQSSNHPTALNYSAMANAYKELIEKCMIDRQGYFNDYI